MAVHENDPSTWRRERRGALDIPVPPRWETLEQPFGVMTLRHPELDSETFHPTIAVRSEPTSASLPALGAQGIAGIVGGLPGARLLAHDRGEVDGRPARGQVYAYDAGEHTIVAERWLLVAGAHAVEITAQCTVEQVEDIQPLVAVVLAHATVSEASAGSGPMPEPLAEPRRDQFLARCSGLDVETLDRMPSVQPYTPGGPQLSDDAFRFCLQHAGRERIGRMDLLASPGAAAELVGVGLMEPDGTVAPAFTLLGLPLASSRETVRVEGDHLGHVSQLDAWMGGGGVSIASRASYAQLVHGESEHAVAPGSVRMNVVREASLPLAIAAWAGLGPAWSVMSATDRIPARLFEDRLRRGPEVPAPEGADEPMRRMWAEPWFLWRLVMPGLDRDLAWLNAGAAGQYRVGRLEDGSLRMVVEPAGYVWDTLVREIGILAHVR